VNVVVLYLLLLKATLTSFSGLASLPMIRGDFVVHYHLLTDRQLNTAVAAGRLGPGPLGIYVVSVGYMVAGVPGAFAGWMAMITPAFLIIPMLLFLGKRAEHRRIKSVTRTYYWPAQASWPRLPRHWPETQLPDPSHWQL
jgi:chromate transporter